MFITNKVNMSKCIIDSWIISIWLKHKFLIISIIFIITLWFISGLIIYISGDDTFLTDFFSAGAAIGAIVIGIGTLLFAKAQSDLNSKTYEYQISQRYIDNYNDLILVFEKAYEIFHPDKEIYQLPHDKLKEYISLKFKDLLHLSSKVKNQASLMFPDSRDIIQLTQQIYDEVYEIYRARESLIHRQAILNDNSCSDEQIKSWQDGCNRLYNIMLEKHTNFLYKYISAEDKYLFLKILAEKYQRYLKV